MRHIAQFLVVLFAFSFATAQAQTAAAPAQNTPAGDAATQQLPAFDVVSVKPHKDEGMMMRMSFQFTPDGVRIDGVQIDSLLRSGFNVPKDRLLNAPEWVSSARFDIEAKVTPEDAPKLKGLTRQQRSAMLIPLLDDRFGLKFHHETRELEVYALVVAKVGSKLKETAPDNASPDAPPTKPEAQGAGHPLRAGQIMMSSGPNGTKIQGRGATIANIADMISQQIGSTVVDKTGLPGKYDYTLTFANDVAAAPPDAGQAQEQEGPSLFTAVQEQLGLKLEAQKQRVDVIVIDHIEQPSAN